MCTFTESKNGLKQRCQVLLSPAISIATYMHIITFEESQELGLTCSYDQCNSNDTYFLFKSLIKQYYDLTAIRKVFLNNPSTSKQEITTERPYFTDRQQIESSTDKSDQYSQTKMTSSPPPTSSVITNEPRNSSSKHLCHFLINIVNFSLILFFTI